MKPATRQRHIAAAEKRVADLTERRVKAERTASDCTRLLAHEEETLTWLRQAPVEGDDRPVDTGGAS